MLGSQGWHHLLEQQAVEMCTEHVQDHGMGSLLWGFLDHLSVNSSGAQAHEWRAVTNQPGPCEVANPARRPILSRGWFQILTLSSLARTQCSQRAPRETASLDHSLFFSWCVCVAFSCLFEHIYKRISFKGPLNTKSRWRLLVINL